MPHDGLRHQRPEWLRLRSPGPSVKFFETLRVVKEGHIRTVCEEANCPNIGECWESKVATFLILGDVCTRNCGFCNIKNGCPQETDPDEAANIARAVRDLGVKYVVITSVTRDDLRDSGSSHFVDVINEIRADNRDMLVEVLTPDFQKNMHDGIGTILRTRPNVFGHNIEVVRRIHGLIKGAPSRYDVSLNVLKIIKVLSPDTLSKTGIMVGIGEEENEVLELIDEVAVAGVDILTIGQYMPPSDMHHPLVRYVEPAEFARYKNYGEEKGIKHVESGPFVRSSYNAFRAFSKVKAQ
jgi:lipoic acid synthetase